MNPNPFTIVYTDTSQAFVGVKTFTINNLKITGGSNTQVPVADSSGNLSFSSYQSPAIPASASSPGVAGTVVADVNYVYTCTVTNTWKRFANSGSTW